MVGLQCKVWPLFEVACSKGDGSRSNVRRTECFGKYNRYNRDIDIVKEKNK